MDVRAAQANCRRFRVHLRAELPPTRPTDLVRSKPLPIELLSAVEKWRNRLEYLQDVDEREKWIDCIRDFIFLDTDKDGIADWTAIPDGRPSPVLFPLDPDQDGDGITNLLDPNPYLRSLSQESAVIPFHLKMDGEDVNWQNRLKKEESILAINHTDDHNLDALKTSYDVFSLSSIKMWKNRHSFFNVLYAFRSHHPAVQIAAYHPAARAISIPGKSSYLSSSLNKEEKCQLVSALLHELGHALLFGTVTGTELREKAFQLGGWQIPATILPEISNPFWLESFNTNKASFVSEYASTNVHEWFAESFAAFVWHREGLDQKYCKAPFASDVASEMKDWFSHLLNK